jgi:SAM-dependent methyltransferase
MRVEGRLGAEQRDRPPVHELDGRFDIVYTSYGTIGWLPDLKPWATNIARYLRPGGQLVFVEFHPAVWMFDNDFTRVQYSYFNRETIHEEEEGTYADKAAAIKLPSYSWNHGLGEVLSALLEAGLRIERFTELDGSPFDCFANLVKGPMACTASTAWRASSPWCTGSVQ